MKRDDPCDEYNPRLAACSDRKWISQAPRGHPGSWDACCGEVDMGTTDHGIDDKWSCSSISPRRHDESAGAGGGETGCGEESNFQDIKGLVSHARREVTYPSPSHRRPDPSTVSRMASFLKLFLACALFLFALAHAGVATHRGNFRDSELRTRSSPIVTVKNGSYEGVYSSEYGQDFFLGMRYAQVRLS